MNSARSGVRSSTAAELLQQFGQLHGEDAALAELAGSPRIGAGATQLVELTKQEFQALGHELLPVRRIRPRTRQFSLCHQHNAQATTPMGYRYNLRDRDWSGAS